MLKPLTGLLGRGGLASLCLAALLLNTDFVASSVAQSTEFQSQPNENQQTQTPHEDILRNSTPEDLVATNIQASPANAIGIEEPQTGQKWTDWKMGPATMGPMPRGLISGYQGLSASLGASAPSAGAANKSEPGNHAPADVLPLEPTTVLAELCGSTAHCATWFTTPGRLAQSEAPESEPQIADDEKKVGETSWAPVKSVRPSKPVDFNQDIYYKNKLEFSFETGWHPVNIPFVYDFAVGDSYNETPLKYTLVPVIASLRWHVNDVGGRWIFRGNFDFTFSLSATLIPRGPETHYFAFIFGVRRNFVHRNWRIVPYFDEQGGVGYIDAKEPLGVLFAQGQDLTFTYNMGTGVRYNLNPRYSLSAGMNYMHISNGYLSEPKFTNYGINVYGPMVGINVRLGKPHDHASE